MGCDSHLFKSILVCNSISYVYFCVNYVTSAKITPGLVKSADKNLFCKLSKIFLNTFFKEDTKANRFYGKIAFSGIKIFMPLKITKPYFTCLEMTHTDSIKKSLVFLGDLCQIFN